MADDKPVTKEIFIEASPEDIFPYLVEGARYRKWMGVAVELEARPGGIFRVDPNGRDVILGRFVEVDPPRRVVFTWGWEEAGHPVPAGSTHVEIELERRDGGTLVRLTHRGLGESSRGRHELGWTHYLARLKTVACGGMPGPDPYADPTYLHG